MRDFKLIFLMLFVASTSLAQQENPRGIFRLTRISDKEGKIIDSPLDQYKLCGDSATVMLAYLRKVNKELNVDEFVLKNADKKATNYTGDRSKEEIGIWFYDCYKTHFTLKWYSEVPNSNLFPYGGWVTEYYDSKVDRSEFANTVINAFLPHKSKNKIEGVWQIAGMDNMYCLIDKTNIILFKAQDCNYQSQEMLLRSIRMDFEYDGKNYIKYGGAEYDTEWQGDNLIKLTSRDTTKKTLLFWQRAELPPAYKAFFETLKD